MANLRYTPLEEIPVRRPVHRIPWILEQARGKKVLDLGAYDETAREKISTDFWLHGKLASVAQQVIGLDDSGHLPDDGIEPFGNSVILKGKIQDLDQISKSYEFDLIVADEVIEHLPNTLDFLKRIKENRRFSNKQLILTTPNATSLHNASLGFFKRESTHADHLQTYSYKTLNTLCAKVGFSGWEILPYHVFFPK